MEERIENIRNARINSAYESKPQLKDIKLAGIENEIDIKFSNRIFR